MAMDPQAPPFDALGGSPTKGASVQLTNFTGTESFGVALRMEAEESGSSDGFGVTPARRITRPLNAGSPGEGQEALAEPRPRSEAAVGLLRAGREELSPSRAEAPRTDGPNRRRGQTKQFGTGANGVTASATKVGNLRVDLHHGLVGGHGRIAQPVLPNRLQPLIAHVFKAQSNGRRATSKRGGSLSLLCRALAKQVEIPNATFGVKGPHAKLEAKLSSEGF